MDAYYEVLTQSRQWAELAIADGYLLPEQTQALFELDNQLPQNLFADNERPIGGKPLLAAFLGGTGVGKSSMLNRLAGQVIAKAGIERPTSREVTLYHHQSLSIQQLPAGLPIHSVKLNQHNNAEHKNIIWMDMPDFDSIEIGNHQLVRQWLPHIDVLIYVVSPERYRDNKTWRLLLNEGMKHAWVFVMNQWDLGLAEQYEDFKQQLSKAGFTEPLVFRTSCAEPDGDEFANLVTQLRSLSRQHGAMQLEQHLQQFRSRQLKLILQQLLAELKTRDFSQLQQFFDNLWQNNETNFLHGLAWPIQHNAKFLTEHPGKIPEIPLWDEWAQSRLEDILDDLVLQADQLGIPCKPLRIRLQGVKELAEKKVRAHTQFAGREALLDSGGALFRSIYKLTAAGETLLPLAAMSIVGYQVFYGYYHSVNDSTPYLGADFAVHSILLIALSWLIPFFLNKKMRPSPEKNARRGLQKGVQLALAGIKLDVLNVLTEVKYRNDELRQALGVLLAQADLQTGSILQEDSLLKRVLLNASNA
jgi:hypothetical protein